MYLHSSSNEYVCDQSRPCTLNEQYLDTNDTLVISGMSNDVCDSTLVEKTVINADKNETHNNRRKYYRYIGDFSEEDLETPRRRKLFWNTHTKMLDEKNQKIRLLERKNRRLESKISSLNTLVDELKKECQLNASYSHILKNIGTEEEKQLLMRQLQISTGKSICPILRKFAMTLHFYSPSAYSYVRTIFSKALPDVSTIRKWYSKLDGLPGMTKESFQAISLKVKEMKVNGKQLYGCLVMDEMSIKHHVHWTGTRHQGYIDFGLGGKTEEMDNLPYAKDAFVIMVVGMNTSWKVPIAYYLINGISAEEKANIILNCLQELDTTGIIIKTLTFDGAANNLSMASELGGNLQYSELKPYFLHPNTNDKIHIILDPCHVNESGLHSATKLRNRHIYYFREKMKVKLAVQTFSTSVANAILFCMNDLKLDNFQCADATIEFCLRINNNFDILNSRNFLSKGTYNKSINKRTKTEIVHYIEESIDYLAGGFNAMKNQQNVDHIEMLFSAIRAKGGFNNNPTVSQFEAAYKSIIVHSEIKSSSSANCMALDDTTILRVSSSNIKVKDTQSELLDLLCVAGTDDLENDNSLSVNQHSNFINDVVACIAGFVVRKIKKNNFMTNHSTIQQIHRLTDQIATSFERKEFCPGIFLDFAQAFDRVWYIGLLYKLKLFLPAPYYLLVRSYLCNRSFAVRQGNSFSSYFSIQARVPQGSDLAPDLFNIYTSDIPKVANTTIATYTDDTAILASNTDLTLASSALQNLLDLINSWATQWRIKINPEKSYNVIFSLRKNDFPPLQLQGVDIPKTSQVKYLGLILDKRLTWGPHLKSKRKTLNNRLHLLRPILKSKMSIHIKSVLYKSLLRPIWAYGMQIWGCAKTSQIRSIQAFQSISLRLIASAPWYITNKALHKDLKIDTVDQLAQNYYAKFHVKLRHHPNPLISHLSSHTLPDNPPRRLKRRWCRDLLN
ncbi:hypothetical protein QTP88_000180 [Uroleucon formosanum]